MACYAISENTYQAQVSLVWKDIKQLHNVGAMQLFQQLDLPESCDIDAFLGLAKSDLLDGYHLSCLAVKHRVSRRVYGSGSRISLSYLFVSSLEYNTEGSFSKGFAFVILLHAHSTDLNCQS